MRTNLLAGLSLVLAGAACQPDLGEPAWLVTSDRVLAVRADPPEGLPGATVSYRALVAGPSGTVTDAAPTWAFCEEPKPLTENDAVSSACFTDMLPPAGPAGLTLAASIPADACAVFGPDRPPGAFRPRDADDTGGYFQPLVLRLDGLASTRLERVVCNLPDAPVDVAIELTKAYVPNRNPTLLAVTASVSDSPVALARIPAGARVKLQTGWGEGDAEGYLMYDPGSSMLVDRREALEVSWLVTAGEIETAVTSRGEGDHATRVETTWTAPSQPGPVFLWMVLRDSRGGGDFRSETLRVVTAE